MTSGRGQFSMEFSHYLPCPAQVSETVIAEAKARMMTIGGNFEGQIEVEKELIILATGKCSGEVKCQDLVVEAGGILNASVTCTSAKALTT